MNVPDDLRYSKDHEWARLEDGRRVPCRASEFPDAFHTDRACSARVRERLDEAARRLH